MKNFKFISYFCLGLLFFTGLSTSTNAQSYVQSSEAIFRVNKALTQLEDRYGQIDRQSDKPVSRKRNDLSRSGELYFDLAKIKIGNAVLKQLKNGKEAAESVEISMQQFPETVKNTEEYQKAKGFYLQLLTI